MPTSKPDTARSQREADGAEKRAGEATAQGKKSLSERLTSLRNRWRRVEQAVLSAFELESEAATLEKRVLELEEQTTRARLLVEQTEARRARALLRLEELKLKPGTVPGGAAAPSPATSTTPATGASKPAPAPASKPTTHEGVME